MNAFRNWKIQNVALILMISSGLLFSIITTLVDFHTQKYALQESIDDRLYTAAFLAEKTLPEDFHERITDADSLSAQEYERIVKQNNDLCRKLGLKYLWSLMLVDGHPVFTTATSPDNETENGKHAAFFEKHTNPELYEKAFRTMEPQHQITIDKWGNLRTVLIPHTDSKGRKYLFGASMETSEVESHTSTIFHNSLLIIISLFIPTLLFISFLSRRLTTPVRLLADAAQRVSSGDYTSPIHISGTEEINVISKQLEAMRLSVFAHVTKLNDSMRDLEEFKKIVSASSIIVYRLRIDPESWPVEFISDNISLLGYSAEAFLSGDMDWHDINYPEDIPAFDEKIKSFMDSGIDEFRIESRLVTADGDIRNFEYWNRLICDDNGEITHIHGLLRDITRLKKAHAETAKHQQILKTTIQDMDQFYQLVTASPVIAFRVRLEENFPPTMLTSNVDKTGYTAEEFLSGNRAWTDLIPHDDFLVLQNTIIENAANRVDNYHVEYRMLWKNGETHWYHSWHNVVRDENGKATHIQGLVSEITELKEAYARDLNYQTRLKHLAQELVRAEDNERRDLAYILHDDIGQMLAGLNMKLSVLHEAEKEAADQLFPQITELLSRIMKTIKSLTWEISPTSLYETDIAAGLEHMANDLQKFFDLDIKIETAGVRIELDRDTSALIFRCAKELLVNIAKHSGTRSADIGISKYNNKVHMVVSDPGSGFNPDKLKNGNGYGLFSIRERLEQINASMHIDSVPGQGTQILMIIPMDAPDVPAMD